MSSVRLRTRAASMIAASKQATWKHCRAVSADITIAAVVFGRRAAVKAVLNQVTVSPHAGRAGGPNWTQEMKLRSVQERTEFDWRF